MWVIYELPWVLEINKDRKYLYNRISLDQGIAEKINSLFNISLQVCTMPGFTHKLVRPVADRLFKKVNMFHWKLLEFPLFYFFFLHHSKDFCFNFFTYNIILQNLLLAKIPLVLKYIAFSPSPLSLSLKKNQLCSTPSNIWSWLDEEQICWEMNMLR